MAFGRWLLATKTKGKKPMVNCIITINMRNFKNYEIWMDSIELTDIIYDICEKFPQKEVYQL